MTQIETQFTLGEDLYGVSVAELRSRLETLRKEILRVEREISKKQQDLGDAQKLFGGA